MSVRITDMDDELCFYCRKLVKKADIVWDNIPVKNQLVNFVAVPCHKECVPSKEKSE